VRKVSGVKDLPWVDIHIEQEPNHVEQASGAVETGFSEGDVDAIEESAEEIWSLWIAFFDRLRAEWQRQEAPAEVAVATA